jgi:uncharacterized protein (TIGR03382 family)
MNQPRAFHSATLLADGRVVVAGGSDEIGTSCTNPMWMSVHTSTEIYDPSANTWTVAGNMTEARTEHQAIVLDNGRVLLSGGRRNSFGRTLASAEVFDPVEKTWTETSRMQSARFGHTLTSLTGGIVTIGGYQPFSPSSTTTSVERFPQADQGRPCSLNDQCKSKYCANNVCCDTACNSQCLACSKNAPNIKGSKLLDEGICEDVSGCAPYACQTDNGSCGTTCTEVDACATGYVCDPTGACIERRPNASTLDETGCTATHVDSNASSWASLALVAGAYALRRRKLQRKS